eukprot:CAMPEP_0168340678 /NCGR_PEP_ID=MMETSP0213-20121227/14208_1 /TAXON_ID=151035 /ORGANISM="Euplotes harpa, Strain FSP1.4" /LENGTH=54 /DNA_ID=CAMNT_0008346963 /DNA_START=211 /DNA_END=375 /DNA_ORIENTATION=-
MAAGFVPTPITVKALMEILKTENKKHRLAQCLLRYHAVQVAQYSSADDGSSGAL